MPDTPTAAAMEAAVDIMQTVFFWDDERCLSPEGRAGIGAVAVCLDDFAADGHRPAAVHQLQGR